MKSGKSFILLGNVKIKIQIGVYIRILLMLFQRKAKICIKSKAKASEFTYGFAMKRDENHKIYFNILRKHMLV